MRYSNEELNDMNSCYVMSGKCSELALEQYRIEYPRRVCPEEEMFESVHRSLRETGTLHKLLWNVNRRHFCNWFQEQQSAHNGLFAQNILFTDEKEYKGNGIHNNLTVNIWAGVINNILLGPVILPTRMNGDNYCDFLKETLPNLLRDIPHEMRISMWFMHDGAPPHSIERVQNILNEKFSEKWIGKGGNVAWPPKSPDLNPMDFYVWKKIKRYQQEIAEIAGHQIVYDIRVYEQEFIHAFNEFRRDPQNFADIKNGMDRRIQACIEKNGGKFPSNR